jgi:hypothetical protein
MLSVWDDSTIERKTFIASAGSLSLRGDVVRVGPLPG